MKRLLPLFCILVILFASAGVASADKPLPDTFTITGYTTSYTFDTLPNGRTSFHVIARGGNDAAYDLYCGGLAAQFPPGTPGSTATTCHELCVGVTGQACGVAGEIFSGEFTFEEWGEVDLNPLTGEGSGKGKNDGIVTLIMPSGQAQVDFKGKTDSVNVWGNWQLQKKDGTGSYTDLKGQGDYTGNAGLVFTVKFEGKVH